MANNATTYLESKLLNHIFKNTAFTSPGNSIYVGLATAVSDAEAGSLTEVTGSQDSNYARQQVQASAWTVPADASTDTQTAKNSANIEFSASSGGATYTVTHVFVADASSGGNILFVGALDANKTIASGDIFRINTNNLVIELN